MVPNGPRTGSPAEVSHRAVPDAEGDRPVALDAIAPTEAAIVDGTANRVPEPIAPGGTGTIPPAVPADGSAPSSDGLPLVVGDAARLRAVDGGGIVGASVPVATSGASDVATEGEPAVEPMVGAAPRGTAPVVPTTPVAVETSQRAPASGTSDAQRVVPVEPVAPVATTSGPMASTIDGSRSDDAVDDTGTGETDRAGEAGVATGAAPHPVADTPPPAVPGDASARDVATPLAARNRGEDVSDAVSERVHADVRHPRSVLRAEERVSVERPAPPVLLAVPASVRRALADGVPLSRGDTGDAFLSTPPAAAVPLAPAVSGQVPDAAPSDTRPALPIGIARALRAAETAPAGRAADVDAMLEASRPDAASRTVVGEAVGTPPATSSSAPAVPIVLAPLATRPEAPLPTSSIAPQTVPLDGAGGGAETLAANVRWTAGEGRGQAWINVSPAALGPLAIRVSVEGEQVSVSIAASQAGAREALEPLIPRLREQLAADGHQSVHVDLSGGREDPRASADGRDARAGAERSGSDRTADGEDERNARHAADARRMPEGPTIAPAGGHALVDAWA